MRKPEIELRKLRILSLTAKGYTPEQICEIIGMSRGAYRNIIFRLRKAGVLPKKK